jgi:hypothetical protein
MEATGNVFGEGYPDLQDSLDNRKRAYQVDAGSGSHKQKKQHFIGLFPTLEESSATVESYEIGEDVQKPIKEKALSNGGERGVLEITKAEGVAGRAKGKKKATQSGHRGVRKNGNRWEARGRKEGKQHYIGLFPTIEEASAAVESHEAGEDVQKPIKEKALSNSGERGVFKDGNRWVSRGRRAGEKYRHIGQFSTIQQAKDARDAYESGQDVPRPPRANPNQNPLIAASGHRGVYQIGSKWASYGKRAGEIKKYLGCFDLIEDAVKRRDAYERGEDFIKPSDGKWIARGRRAGEKRRDIGVYPTKEEAAAAKAIYEQGRTPPPSMNVAVPSVNAI